MKTWRKLLSILGLSKDARVQVRSKDIEVTIIGTPDKVRRMLELVKNGLENEHRARRLHSRSPSGRRAHSDSGQPNTDSQVVRPTDLDEQDSPYAIPQHHPDAAEAATPTSQHAEPPLADTIRPEAFDMGETLSGENTGPEREITQIAHDPSGAQPIPETMEIEDRGRNKSRARDDLEEVRTARQPSDPGHP
jgi:hypothetical protein